ncbi:MAG: HTTM domain-containing protein [Opitutales bacterium]|nr:HTTM domain-containing protein [Opitutales bacterium]
MPKAESPFALDLRSVALFRVFLGALMIFDLAMRFPFAELFLSDAGALSRADHLRIFNRPWSLSVYMMVGEPAQVRLLFGLHAAAALGLVLGYRTRLMAVVCWVMLVSLQHRNPLVLNGGDTLFAVLSFWAVFLPLSARWSVDAALTRGRQDGGNPAETVSAPNNSNRYHALPGAVFVLQICLVYAFTLTLKSGELWRNGEAVGYVLHNIGIIRAGGLWMQQFDWLHPFLTQATFHWEWAGIALLLIPWWNTATRFAAVAGFVTFHASLGWTLDLALFPHVCIAAWLALLPGAFWDSLASLRLSAPLRRGTSALAAAVSTLPLRGGSVRPVGTAAGWMCMALLILVAGWNLRGLPDSFLRQSYPKSFESTLYALKLRQKWGMFAPNPPRAGGWFVIESQKVNGDSLDLFHPAEPFRLARPELFTDRLPDRRWGKWLGNLRRARYRTLREPFLAHMVERWNERATHEHRIEWAELVYFRETIHPGAEPGKAEPRRLATYRPGGTRQIQPGTPVETDEPDEPEDV